MDKRRNDLLLQQRQAIKDLVNKTIKERLEMYYQKGVKYEIVALQNNSQLTARSNLLVSLIFVNLQQANEVSYLNQLEHVDRAVKLKLITELSIDNMEIPVSTFLGSLILNNDETTFVAFSKEAVYLISIVGQMTFENDQERPTALCKQVVSKRDGQGEVVQAAFSNLNPNYLIFLTSESKLALFNLYPRDNAQAVESFLNLKCLDQEDEQPQFVGFSQSSWKASVALQPYSLLLMDQVGSIYTLCPFFPKNLSQTQEDHTMLLDYLSIVIEQQRDMQRNLDLKGATLQQFQEMLRECQVSDQNATRLGNVIVSIPHEVGTYSQFFTPQLVGPFNIEGQDAISYRSLQVTSDIPLSVLRLGDKQTDLLVNFYQPEFFLESFRDTKLEDQIDYEAFSLIGRVQYKKLDQSKILNLKQDSSNSLNYHLQLGQSLKQIQLSFLRLSNIKRKVLREEQITQEDVKDGIQVVDIPTQQSNYMQYLDAGQFLVGFGRDSIDNKSIDFQIKIKEKEESIDLEHAKQNLKRLELEDNKPLVINGKRYEFDQTMVRFCKELNIPIFNGDRNSQQDINSYLEYLSKVLLEDYCGQFEDVQEQLMPWLVRIENLQIHFVKQAIRSQEVYLKAEEEKKDLENQINDIKAKNTEIKNQMKRIKDKMAGLMRYPTEDMMVAVFLQKLENQVQQRKQDIEQLKSKRDQITQMEKIYKNQVAFIHEYDYAKLDEMKQFIFEKYGDIIMMRDKINRISDQVLNA